MSAIPIVNSCNNLFTALQYHIRIATPILTDNNCLRQKIKLTRKFLIKCDYIVACLIRQPTKETINANDNAVSRRQRQHNVVRSPYIKPIHAHQEFFVICWQYSMNL